VSRFTESPDPARDSLVRQALLILAIIVLGLGAIGARVGLRSNLADSEGGPLPTTSPAVAEHAQVHHVANASNDVGPGEAESDLASCPPAVR
jgi:hypothetical protein